MSKVIYESEKRITQHYGVNGHTGVDLGWRGGSADDVYANCTGEVVYIQTGYKQDISARGMESYGNMVDVRHENGYKTRYAHLSEVYVKLHDKVNSQTKLGHEGDTGKTSAKHLHYEAFNNNGVRINPEPYLTKRIGDENGGSTDCTGDITYKAYDNVKNEWLPEVVNNKDYAGNLGNALGGLKIKCVNGDITYQVHLKDGTWLDKVNSKTYNNQDDNSYAGIYGKLVDGIKIWSSKGYVTYRVHLLGGNWLEWVDSRNSNGSGADSYAGIIGKAIDAIEMF